MRAAQEQRAPETLDISQACNRRGRGSGSFACQTNETEVLVVDPNQTADGAHRYHALVFKRARIEEHALK